MPRNHPGNSIELVVDKRSSKPSFPRESGSRALAARGRGKRALKSNCNLIVRDWIFEGGAPVEDTDAIMGELHGPGWEGVAGHRMLRSKATFYRIEDGIRGAWRTLMARAIEV
ncbi:hypothetical protein KM043_003647 [Ampulex compressa]|nr:hypothetical protein KM043_003647 [Ampulex compressa]